MKLSNAQLNINRRVCLPRLDTLILVDFSFGDDKSFLKVVDGCPILQTLCLVRHIYGTMSTLLVSSPSLKWLDVSLEDDYGYYELEKLEINALSLEFLNISYCIIREIILNSLPCYLEPILIQMKVVALMIITTQLLNQFKVFNMQSILLWGGIP